MGEAIDKVLTTVGVMEGFSPKNASEALGEIFDAIPKGKRPQFLGHLNEVGIVLDSFVSWTVMSLLGDRPEGKFEDEAVAAWVAARSSLLDHTVTDIIRAYLEKMAEAMPRG